MDRIEKMYKIWHVSELREMANAYLLPHMCKHVLLLSFVKTFDKDQDYFELMMETLVKKGLAKTTQLVYREIIYHDQINNKG